MGDDLVDRLRDTAYEVDVCWEAATEIEQLRAALSLAVGELSTHHQYTVYSPDQLMQQFLQEARRG
jgi:hypothetical protein